MARGVGRPMAVLVLSDEERSYLERQARRRRVARSLSDRCRMILRCADGLTNKAVAIELGVHEHTVGKWRRRFLKERIEGLSDEPRPGRPRTLSDEKVAKVVERTLETTPADATHWSLRSMARESGLSHTTVRRIWAAPPSPVPRGPRSGRIVLSRPSMLGDLIRQSGRTIPRCGVGSDAVGAWGTWVVGCSPSASSAGVPRFLPRGAAAQDLGFRREVALGGAYVSAGVLALTKRPRALCPRSGQAGVAALRERGSRRRRPRAVARSAVLPMRHCRSRSCG